MSQGFKIKSEIFEGPIDLLLDLIEKRKLHISNVSLAAVADDYLAYIKDLEQHPITETAQFLVVASTLLLIKSRSLLPTLEISEEESANIDDLEKRLRLLAIAREAGNLMKGCMGSNSMFLSNSKPETVNIFAPTSDLNTTNLFEKIMGVISALPKLENKLPETIVRSVISLEEMMDNLARRVQKHVKMRFSDFAGLGKAAKIDIVVSFLAMLELVKQGAISVTQHNNFSDIEIETQNYQDVPNYS